MRASLKRMDHVRLGGVGVERSRSPPPDRALRVKSDLKRHEKLPVARVKLVAFVSSGRRIAEDDGELFGTARVDIAGAVGSRSGIGRRGAVAIAPGAMIDLESAIDGGHRPREGVERVVR